ncbi:MAG: ABC transporter ATP-binding protein/permease [Oscillospiraceae bacterium]|jgi:putative ABC transport system permease protein|nr:ABC transporter ATP-binding protein/permease [Oscillospiraceae bacterium]
MLQLKNIVKHYTAGDMTVEALRDVSLDFRKSEFVAVLGPSGCGKTTLLNIVGGLDRYTSGDLIINGISTKKYKDVDWDIYRNNSIGFVFQSYNLIPHQTALANVELAMTLAGISKGERRKRAVETLEKVGLSDQLHKKPNQMSGGQMQRVSIARALVNNPDILLADEPTGALDSETSVQIMDILREIAKDRLVIMVTHNPDLADQYANRVIRLLDGRVTDDTNPFRMEDLETKTRNKRKKVSMSYLTAVSLSLNNLLTKKTRTVLTAFAGSIGIIGIALIMSLSSGMQGYIDTLEQDTLSTYPIRLQSQTMDMTAMMTSMMDRNLYRGDGRDPGKIYANNIMTRIIESMSTMITRNDLARFKAYIETGDGRRIREMTSSIKYGYDVELQVYKSDTSKGVLQVNPSEVMASLGMGGPAGGMDMNMGMGMNMSSGSVWTELLSGEDDLIHSNLLHSQYDVVAGRWPEAFDEVVLVVNRHNEISDFNLYTLGLLDADELDAMLAKLMRGEPVEESEPAGFTHEELLALTFKLVLNTGYYAEDGGRWADMRDDGGFMKKLVDSALDIRVVGIIRPSEQAMASSINGTVGYTSALTEYVVSAVRESEIAKQQLADPETNVFTGISFDVAGYVESLTMEDVYAYIAGHTEEEQALFAQMTATMPEEELLAFFKARVRAESGEWDTYDSNRALLGIADFDNPGSISLYPKDFASKEELVALIDEYNKAQEDAGNEEYAIRYTDIVGLMTSGISSIIDIVSYVLIAFVSISLIVSSIMIAIITYISVLERTKEIGILRSIGAAKRDISRVFNAETLIEGFVAGVLGILITLLLNIPINAIIKRLADISDLSALPLAGGVGLILLSMILTVIAGFIPSKMAAKKDPVVALRTE